MILWDHNNVWMLTVARLSGCRQERENHPKDVNAVYGAIRSGGINGLTTAAQIIRNK